MVSSTHALLRPFTVSFRAVAHLRVPMLPAGDCGRDSDLSEVCCKIVDQLVEQLRR
jgi:hypothetical protein